jgi:hypothetical protein
MATDMKAFDFQAPAELFPARGRRKGRQTVSYKRFDSAAFAIRFAMEELDADLLPGAILEIDEERYDDQAIRDLYASAAYPLKRAVAPSVNN